MANVEQTILAVETSISINDEEKYIAPSGLVARGQRPRTRRGSRYPVKIFNKRRHKSDTRFHNRLFKPFLIVYAIWIALTDLKFQHEKGSQFRAQWFFFVMSPVALCITITVFWLLFLAKNYLKSSNMVRKILKSVLYFFGILAHLSLVLLIFIPPKLNWIGYSIISGVFMAMIAYTFHDHIMSLIRVISSIWERNNWFKENKASSCSTSVVHV